MPDQHHPQVPPEPEEPAPQLYYPSGGASAGGTHETHGTSGSGMIWAGIALSFAVTVLSGVGAGAVSAVPGIPGAVLATVSSLWGVALFLAPIVMLFFARSRKFGIGMLIGFAVQLILAAGACIMLLVALSGMHN